MAFTPTKIKDVLVENLYIRRESENGKRMEARRADEDEVANLKFRMIVFTWLLEPILFLVHHLPQSQTRAPFWLTLAFGPPFDLEVGFEPAPLE